MGSSNSTERLDIPLNPQFKPVAAIHPRLCASEPLSLQAKTSAWSSKISIVNAHTGAPVFEVRSSAFSSRQVLRHANGDAIATLKSSTFSSKFKVLEGKSDNELFRVELQSKLFKESTLSLNFTDRITGEQCGLTAQGNWDERVVVIYLKRGTTASPQPVARLRRPKTGTFQSDALFIEIMPGVDMALIVLVWLARWTTYIAEQSCAATGVAAC